MNVSVNVFYNGYVLGMSTKYLNM